MTQPDRPAGRGHKLTPTPVKAAALEYGVPVYEPVSLKEFTAQHAGEAFDLFALASYGKILPAALLALPKHGALNVHPSLLPKYRGATPIQSALLNGDSETGVTIMLMDAGMDTGPIVLQERTQVAPSEKYGELHDRLANFGAALLSKAMRSTMDGSAVPHPQEGEPTVTKPIRKEELEIDWKWNAKRIHNFVRAYAPAPVARAKIQGLEVKILGTALAETPGAMRVPCGDGAVYVTRVVTSGKGPMSGAQFEQSLGRNG